MVARVPGSKRGSRALFAFLLVVALVAALSGPAAAKPGGNKPGGGGGTTGGTGGTSVTLTLTPDTEWNTSNIGCGFNATYRWSGFKGRSYNASVRLYDATTGGYTQAPVMVGLPGNYEVTYFFVFGQTQSTSRGISARAALTSGGVEVAGSVVTSSSLSVGCGGSMTVRWLTTIPLS